MAVRVGRPNTDEMVFLVFDRSVHPELFAPVATREIKARDFEARASICAEGHVIEFFAGQFPLTEVMTSDTRSFPQHKRVCDRKIIGQRDHQMDTDFGVGYHGCYQLEKLRPEIFMNVHEEYLQDCESPSALGHCFTSPNRFSPSPLSVIQITESANALLVHSYHTFPDHCAVIKSQSLFELT